eukprot:gene7474-8304_t
MYVTKCLKLLVYLKFGLDGKYFSFDISRSETVLQTMDAPMKIKPDPDMLLSASAPSSSSSYLMRTNFKQQLQKEHIMQIEKRQTNNVRELLSQSSSMSIPNEKPPVQNVSPDVPVGILKAHRKLSIPIIECIVRFIFSEIIQVNKLAQILGLQFGKLNVLGI